MLKVLAARRTVLTILMINMRNNRDYARRPATPCEESNTVVYFLEPGIHHSQCDDIHQKNDCSCERAAGDGEAHARRTQPGGFWTSLSFSSSGGLASWAFLFPSRSSRNMRGISDSAVSTLFFHRIRGDIHGR